MPIPRIFHQIWYQGESRLPLHLKEYRQSWIAQHPNFTFAFWDQPSIENLVNQSEPWIKDHYFSYELMIQRIDFAKYVILHHFGGIYMDIDVKCIKPIDDLLSEHSEKNVILSKCPYDFVHHSLMFFIGLRLGEPLINNGIMMCNKGHSIMTSIMKTCFENRATIFRLFGNNFLHIFATTGPVAVTKAFRKVPKGDVTVLDHTFFEACDIHDVKKYCEIPKHAIGLHVYEGSWVSPFEKLLTNSYFFIKDRFVLIIIFLIIFLKFRSKYMV